MKDTFSQKVSKIIVPLSVIAVTLGVWRVNHPPSASVEKRARAEERPQIEEAQASKIPPKACENQPDPPFDSVGILLFSDSRCTGVLIRSDIVLTAAHCLWRKPLSKTFFSLTTKPEEERQFFATAKQFIFHPDYQGSVGAPKNDGVDVGLVILDKGSYGPIPKSFPQIAKSVNLDSGSFMNIGYGNDGEEVEQRKKSVFFAGYETIQTPGRQIERGLLKFSRGISDSFVCPGDSGSPVLREVDGTNLIFGIASTLDVSDAPSDESPSKACVRSNQSFFASADGFREWVENEVARLPASSRIVSACLIGDAP